MTDFESASLAAQQAALWVAIVVAVATCISAIAATVAAGGIWYGIRAMIRANKDRAGILDRQREADERRHDETMAAFAQQHRDGERRHEENMAALADQRRALEALIGGLERQTASLEAVVERTAPRAGVDG